jgi:SAM-dependent methyltransferase
MRFDADASFGDDYLHFYGAMLDDERSDGEAEEIVAHLGLGPEDTLLDAPCGHGRISNRLAARGLRVIGVDRSSAYLELARKRAASLSTGPSADLPVEYRQGDLRELPTDGPFDAALSWFTSFGYFDDDGNRRSLAEYRRVLRPGGRLLLELHNHDEFVRRFTPAPFSSTIEVGDDLMVDTTRFDCVEGTIETDRLVVRDGSVRRTHFSIRLPTIPELRAWLHEAGFASVHFVARDGGPPRIDRPRLVVIATA